MLSQISIKKFLYFKDVDINLSKGLNVFTGETGAGKSLLIDAISFVLGEKARFENGDFVELIFENIDNEYAEDKTLIVARQIKNGKSVFFLNGRRATLSTIKEATRDIIEIHSQNHQQKLLKREYHRALLDSFAKNEELLKKYREFYREYKNILEKEKELKDQQANRLKELDILKFQLEELKNANLNEGEKEELEKKYEYLSNVSFIKENIMSALYVLEEEENSINSKMSYIKKLLSKISHFNQEIQHILENIETAQSILSDVSFSLSKLDIDVDPRELEYIESRLDLLNWLEKKYNTDEKGLIKLIKEIENRIEYLENLEFELPKLEKEKEKVYKELVNIAEELSNRRKEAAKGFDRLVEEHLKDLALKNAVFKTQIEEKELDTYGKDKIVFLFSANPGFEPKPLDKVASGGEISRLSLALKLVSGSSVECMIYDEIDTGIGGKTGVLIAQKLKALSKNYQVILITHLPQVAAVADKQFHIDKIVEENRTYAKVKELTEKERELEIARMLSGIVDKTSTQLAKNLIQSLD